MDISLKEFTGEDFDQYINWSAENYATDTSKYMDISIEQALEDSKKAFRTILPQGFQSKNHFFYMIKKQTQAVGVLWFAIKKERGEQSVWIYDIHLYESFRGKGLGVKAMELVEHKTKQLGFNQIGLHVFAKNTPAIKLYEKMGYETKNIVMHKKLS